MNREEQLEITRTKYEKVRELVGQGYKLSDSLLEAKMTNPTYYKYRNSLPETEVEDARTSPKPTPTPKKKKPTLVTLPIPEEKKGKQVTIMIGDSNEIAAILDKARRF